ncbi:MAG: DNA modification methylase [Lactobacillus sp.]|nr:MAG: DNA modification methylase [Lactobacillus sp.]
MKTAELRTIKVSELKPAEYNPRKKLKPGDKEYEKIKKSIQEFGFADPLVVNKDMTVIGGHQRLTVATELGYTEVPCAVVDVDKTREKALNIALNKITGAWDEEMLAALLKDIEASGLDAMVTGFEPPEMEQLFNKVAAKEVSEDDFDVDEELKKPTFSKPGDEWHLGRHTVICGDSTLPETYTHLMDGVSANAIVTDPPYNVNVEETAGKIKNDNMPDEDFYKFILSAFKCMYDCLADDGSIYVFHADTEGLNFRKAFADAGFYLSGCCIWKKNALVLGRSPYQWQHEPVLFGWKKNGRHEWYSDRKQTTIWEYDRPKASKDHPTTKPVQLMAYPIRNSSMTNEIILDPFLGSGSTLIACEETDRVCCGIELDPKFVDVEVERFRNYMADAGKPAEVYLIRDGQRMTYEEAVADMPKEDSDGV